MKTISAKTELQESAILNLLNFESDSIMAYYLNILPANLDCVLNEQANYNVAKIFGLTQADLDNLLFGYGKEFILGMIIAKLLLVKKSW